MNELPELKIAKLLHEAFQAKVWTDINRAFETMDEDEQTKILDEFEYIVERHGDNSDEMCEFFHKCCMRYSKLYFFVNTYSENNWDEAFEKELQ